MRSLVERRLRRHVGVFRRRLVQVAHCLRKAPQAPGLARPWRKRLGEICRIARERAMHELAQDLLCETRGSRIHGGEALRQRCPGLDHVESGMNHLQPELTFAHLAERAYALARRERFRLARTEVEESKHELLVAGIEQAHELA